MLRAFYSAIILAIFFPSCKKNDTGGDATITASVYHGSTPIHLPTFYVKFDAVSAPADPVNDYDLKIDGKHENHVHIKELRYGTYYVYATGFDSTIMKPVKGGVEVKIKWKDRKKESLVDIQTQE